MSTSDEWWALPREVVARLRAHPRWQMLKEVLYGMFLYDSVRTLRRQRSELENLFILTMFGDIVGVPILPPYYSLRLLPFTVPYIQSWKNRLLRERDITDLIG